MSLAYVSEKRASSRIRAHLQGLVAHPELQAGLPRTLEHLKKALDEVLAVSQEREQLKAELKLKTMALHGLLRDLLEQVRANLAVAAMIHQPNSDAIELLGGKRRTGGRRSGKKQEDTVADPAKPGISAGP